MTEEEEREYFLFLREQKKTDPGDYDYYDYDQPLEEKEEDSNDFFLLENDDDDKNNNDIKVINNNSMALFLPSIAENPDNISAYHTAQKSTTNSSHQISDIWDTIRLAIINWNDENSDLFRKTLSDIANNKLVIEDETCDKTILQLAIIYFKPDAISIIIESDFKYITNKNKYDQNALNYAIGCGDVTCSFFFFALSELNISNEEAILLFNHQNELINFKLINTFISVKKYDLANTIIDEWLQTLAKTESIVQNGLISKLNDFKDEIKDQKIMDTIEHLYKKIDLLNDRYKSCLELYKKEETLDKQSFDLLGNSQDHNLNVEQI